MSRNRISQIHRFKKTHLSLLFVSLVLSVTVSIPIKPKAQTRVNLPRLSTRLVVPDEYHAMLTEFFDSVVRDTSIELNATAERILLDILPEDYPSGCQEMILHWGTVADGTATMSVRVLFNTALDSGGVTQVLLVYRCFSLYEGYRDKFYDERLAALHIEREKSSLIMLPHAEDDDNFTELSHITLDRIMKCNGIPLVCLRIESSNDNPCCDGPYSYNEDLLNYYIPDSTGFKLVASIVKHREDNYYDIEGALVDIYNANITLQENQDGNISQIVSEYSLKEDEELRETGKITLIWNDEKRVFEPAGD